MCFQIVLYIVQILCLKFVLKILITDWFHIPSVSNVFVSMKDFLLEAHNRIPNLVGIKFTHNNLMEMQQYMALNNEQFEILHGYDEVLLGGLALGAKGAVGSTYNYIAGCYQNIMHEFDNGNITEARKLQLVSVEVVEVLIKYGGGVRAGKAIMGLKGLDCGPARAPIKKFNKQELLNLRTDLEKTEFFKNK